MKQPDAYKKNFAHYRHMTSAHRYWTLQWIMQYECVCVCVWGCQGEERHTSMNPGMMRVQCFSKTTHGLWTVCVMWWDPPVASQPASQPARPPHLLPFKHVQDELKPQHRPSADLQDLEGHSIAAWLGGSTPYWHETSSEPIMPTLACRLFDLLLFHIDQTLQYSHKTLHHMQVYLIFTTGEMVVFPSGSFTYFVIEHK